jgi:uncharacterized protein YlaI
MNESNGEFCPKTYFINEKYANEFINKLKATSQRIKKPVRAYLCDKCLNWHLTSKTEHQFDVLQQYKKELKQKNLQITDLLKQNKELRKKYNLLKLEHERRIK